MIRTRLLVTTAAIGATALFAACGDDDTATLVSPGVALDEGAGDEDAEDSTETDTDDVDTDDTVADAEDVDTDREEEVGIDDAEPADAVVSQVFTVSDDDAGSIDVRVDVIELERDGDVARLSLVISNTDDSNAWSPFDTFAASQVADFTLSGVSLVDLTNDLRHLTLEDSAGGCVCTDLGAGAIAAGESVTAEASFSAPDPGVAEVDLQLGALGLVPSVPVTDR